MKLNVTFTKEIMAIEFKDLKGPSGLSILGNLPKMKMNHIHHYLGDWADQFGSIYKLVIGPFKITVVMDSDTMQQILRGRPENFRRLKKIEKILVEEGIYGVFTAEGDGWKAHRRVVNKGFDVKHQQQFFPEMSKILDRLYNKWKDSSAVEIDITDDLLKFTIDMTTSLAFGQPLNALEGKGGEIQEHLAIMLNTLSNRLNAPIPLWRYVKGRKTKQFDHSVKVVDAFMNELIYNAKNKISSDPILASNPENFIQSLLIAANSETLISDKDIKGNLFTVLVAGQDTTAYTISWAIYYIMKHPEIRKKMQEESDLLLKNENSISSHKDHTSFVFTEAVILETMRLKPVGSISLVQPIEDQEINGYLFKKNCKILMETRHAAIQEKHFINADQFTPQRWIENKKGRCPLGHDSKASIPFGAGVRICPGMNTAMLEMKMVLTMLVKNFEIELSTPIESITEELYFNLRPSTYKVKLRKITE